MRICPQCKNQMVEGYNIKVVGGAYGIKVTKGDKLFSERLDEPKLAICPECGEISMYMENLNKLKD